jgi:hypothetical protein
MWIAESNPVRPVDASVPEPDFGSLEFERAEPADTGHPTHYPATHLKICICGTIFPNSIASQSA